MLYFIIVLIGAALAYLLLLSGQGTAEAYVPVFPQPSPLPRDTASPEPQSVLESVSTWLSQASRELSGTIVASNPATWPRGDRLWDVCRAVAFAEGYNVPGSVPALLNNPGDLSDGAGQFGYENHSGSRVTTFPDANTGWNWLYNKFSNIVQGKSSTYGQYWTFLQIGQKYAGNWSAWVANVTRNLGVTPETRLIDYVNS